MHKQCGEPPQEDVFSVPHFDDVFAERKKEADEFYDDVSNSM